MTTHYGLSFDSDIQWDDTSISVESQPLLKARWTFTPQAGGTVVSFCITLFPSTQIEFGC